MLISKFPHWICALALGGVLTAHAQDNPAQAAARAALQEKMNELDANPEATPAATAPVVETPAPAATAPAAVATEATTPAPAEIKASVAKPAPSSAPALSKDERLMLLLARYKADQITPEQYHTQRAAIIAEP